MTELKNFLGRKIKMVFEDSQRVTSVPCSLKSIGDFAIIILESGAEMAVSRDKIIRIEVLA